MAGVVDTSVLYAALDADDLDHPAAAQMLGRHLGLEIPPVVWSELDLTIRKRRGPDQARETLPAFLQVNPHVEILDADLHPRAADIWSRHGRVSYADCHAIAGALLLGGPLVTIDKEQAAVWRHERKRS